MVDYRKFKEGAFDYKENRLQWEKIDPGWVVENLSLKHSYQVDISAANNTTGNLDHAGALANLSQVLVRVNDSNRIIDITGYILKAIQYFGMGSLINIDSDLGDGNADPVVDVYLNIPLRNPFMANPFEFALDGRQANPLVNSIDIGVRFGPATDINSNANGYINGEEPTLDVWSQKSAGHTLEQTVTRNGTTRQVEVPFTFVPSFFINHTFDVSQSSWDNYQMEAMRDYYGFLIHTYDNNGDVDLGTAFDEIMIKSSGTTYDTFGPRQLHENARHVRSKDAPNNWSQSDNASFQSWGYAPHGSDGRVTQTLDKRQLAELYIRADGTANNSNTKVDITPITFDLEAAQELENERLTEAFNQAA